MGSNPIGELRRTWETAAPGWAHWEERFSAGLSQATEELLDMAEVRPGMRVLDVACGAGSQTLRAALRVGPTGQVLATDIAATMLAHLRENAERAGLSNIETVECAAEELDPGLGPFDAAISRLGLMLFSSPAQALVAIRKLLRRGARVAALVFTTPAANPFMARPMQVLLRHAHKEPAGPGRLGIFALGGPGALERVMTEAGLVELRTRIIRAPLRLTSSADALTMIQQAFGAYRAVLSDLGETEKTAAWAEVAEVLREFETARGLETEFEFIIGAGSNDSLPS
ncbi:MAG: class I SAM-dependent methyltransferase [Thiohalocapsa sp.]